MHVLSVSKSYKHRGGDHVHRPSTKKHWMVYYVTDEGQFASKSVSPLMAAYYKGKRERYINMVCNSCYGAFTVFYKKPKELEEVECPACAANFYDNHKGDKDEAVDDDDW
jgi:hypothetical protein